MKEHLLFRYPYQERRIPTKLFKKLAIALTVITTAFVLGTTALAGLYDQGSGGSFISAKYGSYADIISPYITKYINTGDVKVFEPLYPTNDIDCPVQWCCVVSPMMQYDAKADQAAAVWLLNTERRFAEMAHSWRTICDFSGKNKNRLASLV